MSDIVDGRIVSAAESAATADAGIVPRVALRVRPGTAADVPWIDAVQKAHGRELGFLPTMALMGKIERGEVLIAEGVGSGESRVGREDGRAHLGTNAPPSTFSATRSAFPSPLPTPNAPLLPVGYLIASDRYYRRDEVGCVTQIGVLPEYRRHLVAATLLQAQFDRSAYGCRLYCCWCAQDLKANEFWEAMGFTPIAFRTGSRTKGKTDLRSPICDLRLEDAAARSPASSQSQINNRKSQIAPRIHIFWQKRVRENDTTTPWWYPAKTEGGEMREDRLVFPIPPGTHWRDVLPVVLPETANAVVGESVSRRVVEDGENDTLRVGRNDASIERVAAETPPTPGLSRLADSPTGRPAEPPLRGLKKHAAETAAMALAIADPANRAAAREAIRECVRINPPKAVRPAHIPRGGFWGPPDYRDYQPSEGEIDAELLATFNARKRPVKKTAAKPERKIDPRLTAMARELRDRWSEQSAMIAALPGKHDVRRALTGANALPMTPAVRALPSAA